MLQISVKEAKIKLDDLIQAAKNGEEIVIVTDEQETYQIIRVEKPKKRRKAGSAKGIIEIVDDFNAPLEDFKEYTPQYGSAEGLFEIAEDFDAPLEDFKNYEP